MRLRASPLLAQYSFLHRRAGFVEAQAKGQCRSIQYTLGVNFTSGVGTCAEIVEPFKHLLRVTTRPQFLVLELRAPMGACQGQYGKSFTMNVLLSLFVDQSRPITFTLCIMVVISVNYCCLSVGNVLHSTVVAENGEDGLDFFVFVMKVCNSSQDFHYNLWTFNDCRVQALCYHLLSEVDLSDFIEGIPLIVSGTRFRLESKWDDSLSFVVTVPQH